MNYVIFLASLTFLAWAAKGFLGVLLQHESIIRAEDFGAHAVTTFHVNRCGDDNVRIDNMWQDTERRGSGR